MTVSGPLIATFPVDVVCVAHEKPMMLKRGVVAMAAGQTMAWACLLYVFPALLLRWEQSLGWSKTMLTVAVSLALVMSAVFSPLAGRMIDHGKGAMLMAVSCGVGGVAICLLSIIAEPWQFLALSAIAGCAMAGCLYEPCFALVTRAYGAHAKQSIIAITLIAGFASTISFPAAHWLSDLYGWRFTVGIFGIVALTVAAPLLWLGATRLEAVADKSRISSDRTDGFYHLLTRQFVLLAIAFALLAIVHGATLHHLIPLLVERGLALHQAVLIASVIGPMQVFGRVVIMALDKRTTNDLVAVCCFGALAMAIAFLLATQWAVALAVPFVVLFGSGYGIVSVIRPVIAREVLGNEAFGSKTGVLALFYLLGSAISPFFGAVIWTVGGYQSLLVFLLLFVVIGLTLYRAARRDTAINI